jgi:hypothetical protein
LRAQRNHAPVAGVILFDEMLDPLGGRKIRHVGGQQGRRELERQSQAIGKSSLQRHGAAPRGEPQS